MSSPNSPLVYFVLHEGVEQGPFTLEMIGSMIAAGIYFAPLQVRESRSDSYQILEISPGSATGPQAQQVPARVQRKADETSPARMILGGLAGGIVLVIALVAMFSGSKSKVSRPPMPYDEQPAREATDRGMTVGDGLAERLPGDPDERIPSKLLSKAELEAIEREGNRILRRTQPEPDIAPELQPFFRDSSGQFHYVSVADCARRTPIKEKLDLDGDAIDQEDKQMLAAFDSIETERIALDNSDQRAIDAFNRKVADLNQKNLALRSKIDAFNQRGDAFNAELKRVAIARPH